MRIKNPFARTKRTGVTHNFTHPVWGHSITIRTVRGKHVSGSGWGGSRGDFIGSSASRPRVGDCLLIKQRGDEFRLLVTAVDYVRDPGDMFHFEAQIDEGTEA